MKKSFILVMVLTLSQALISQVPEKMSYQAVVRNASGELLKSGSVGIRVSVLRGSVTGSPVYVETHTLNTNVNGLVSLEIGGGSPASGTFTGIDWSSGMYFIKNEIDPTGGTNYTISGTSQLLAVPYAMYAKKAENGFSGNYNDLTNRPVLFDGNWVNINNKPSTLTGYGITDALSISHPANSITSTLLSNWNTAFGWGNHAGLYRSISYVPSWNEISNKPTTLTGFGITDGVNSTGNQTIDGNKTFTGTISASNRAIINLANPTNGQDAATKSYVDNNQSLIIFQEANQSIIGNNSPILNTGYRNVFIGKSSGMSNLSGTYNTFIGSEAGFTNTNGTNNIAIGQNALRENNGGNHNIGIGTNALEKNKLSTGGGIGSGNIAIGTEAMRNAISNDNVAVGTMALSSVTNGAANTALGIHALRYMVSGSGNTALGGAAMMNSANGSDNIAIGRDAGNEIAGSGNVFIGNQSGRTNHGGSNIFIGYLSGYGNTWQNVSNRLIIHNGFNSTDIPLVYGEFDNNLIRINGTLNVRDVLKLTPRATAPSNPTEGDIYYNSTTHKLMVFDGSSWMACW